MTTTTSPSNTTPRQYISYNKQPIEVGMKVFQMAFDADQNPILKDYDVIELMANGTLKLQYTQMLNGFVNRFVDFSPPDKVHTVPAEMIQIWLDQALKEAELLPKRIKRWEEMLELLKTIERGTT